MLSLAYGVWGQNEEGEHENICCYRVSQPLLLGRLVRYFSLSKSQLDSDITLEEAYIYAAGVVLCSALNIFVIHPYMMAIIHMGMKIRVTCCSLIYRKVILCVTVGNIYSDCKSPEIYFSLSLSTNKLHFDVSVLLAVHFYIIIIHYLNNFSGPHVIQLRSLDVHHFGLVEVI